MTENFQVAEHFIPNFPHSSLQNVKAKTNYTIRDTIRTKNNYKIKGIKTPSNLHGQF